MRDTDLPIILNRVLYAARRLVLVNEQECNPDGTPMDFTGNTVEGDVRVALDPTSTKLASISFANDLPLGKIYAYITAADATEIAEGATAEDTAGTKIAYFDIKRVDSLGEPEQRYAGTLRVSQVVTP